MVCVFCGSVVEEWNHGGSLVQCCYAGMSPTNPNCITKTPGEQFVTWHKVCGYPEDIASELKANWEARKFTAATRVLEFQRGEADARVGHPPAALAGPYLDGYVQTSERPKPR